MPSPLPIEFSINYSHPAADLLARQAIKLDRFKCPDWPNLVAEAGKLLPVAVHFNLITGNSLASKTPWAAVEHNLAHTGTPYVNLHLAAFSQDFPTASVSQPTSKDRLLILETLLADIQAVVSRFGPERVIVENVPYTSSGQLIRTCIEPDFIQEVIALTGCGLLLDLAHARMSAEAIGMATHTYLEKLPLNSLREMHVTGVNQVDGQARDHLAMTSSDWAVLDSSLERIKAGDWPRPWMAAFEYGGIGEKFSWRCDPTVIASQVPRLYEKIKSL